MNYIVNKKFKGSRQQAAFSTNCRCLIYLTGTNVTSAKSSIAPLPGEFDLNTIF